MGLVALTTLRAQRLPRPQIQAPRRDTTRRDTTGVDSAMAAKLRLSPPDSVMQALLRKSGYTVTRYEGDRVTFDAQNDLFQILGAASKRAIVQRGDSQTVYADTGVFFNQRTKVATAIGQTIVMHDPGSGQADVVGRGRLEYSLNERSATISNPRFSANTGAVWQISAQKGKAILGDSAAGKSSAFYGLGGELTSCTDSIPDYHFKFDEVKRSGANTLVARPAVLYIKDIPVMWLPFMFSDMRPGRHSGILTPRFGVSDLIRTNPSYRRNVENVGYFLSINDYMDASAWFDWRSSAGATQGDPGWVKYSGEWRYNWLDRFLTGNLASWLQWTPNFNYSAQQSLHIDQTGDFAFRYITGANGLLDSVRTKRDHYLTAARFDTPITIFGYALGNLFTVNEELFDYPQKVTLNDATSGASLGDRIFPNFYKTEIDWTPNFQLPPLFRILFNVTPSVGLANATSGPFWLRTNLSDGKFVHQTKVPSFSLAASPAIYGLLPGFGPFSRLRHTLQPSISYNYAPRADVSAEYLRAAGRSKAHEFTGLQTNQLTFGLNQNIEAKVRSRTDTSADASEKIKLLSLSFSSLSYNIDQAHAAHKAIRGLTTSTFSYNLSSDLLPGFQFQSGYSLFQGSPLSDTAVFKPYLETVSASFNLAQGNNPFTVLTRLFGRAVPNDQRPTASPTPDQTGQRDDQYVRQISNQPVAGSGARGTQFIVPPSQGWSAALTFSSNRTRPPVGSQANVVVIDPLARCRQLAAEAGTDPVVVQTVYQTCVIQSQAQTTSAQNPLTPGIAGATFYRNPPMTNLGADLRFSLTEKWAVSWNTQYDFTKHQFAQHYVTLQRDLHDWRAVFAFTQSANGNFAFNFFIALKAEPDLKFDYNKSTVRSGGF